VVQKIKQELNCRKKTVQFSSVRFVRSVRAFKVACNSYRNSVLGFSLVANITCFTLMMGNSGDNAVGRILCRYSALTS